MRTLAMPTADPTPPRPAEPLPPPHALLRVSVEVEVAHLANPLLAVQRLLASEAGLFARVDGDDDAFTVEIALPDSQPETRATGVAWLRWAVHCAGVRGELHVDTPASAPLS